VIRRVQNQQVCVREPPLAYHFLHGGGGFGARAVAHYRQRLRAVLSHLLAHARLCLLDATRLYIHAYRVPSEPDRLDKRRAEAHEGVYHQFAALREAAHRLLGYLRHEVAPVFRRVRACVVALTQQPQAVGDNIVILRPVFQIDFAQRVVVRH
jgi:hypothetical protein